MKFPETTLTRRGLLKGLIASAVAAEAKQGPDTAISKVDPDPDQAAHWYTNNAHLPETFKNRVFLGYRALPYSVQQANDFGGQFPSIKAAIDIMRAPDPLFAYCHIKKQLCTDENNFIDMKLEKIPAVYRNAAMQFAGEIASREHDYEINHLTNYDSRVSLVAGYLIDVLRDVDYKTHNDNEGLAKTPGQLMADGWGDCKDFALARYLIAQYLGVLPEHLAIIQYSAETGAGHWNLAIYIPDMQNWFIVDGTGRQPGESKGLAELYTNDQTLWQRFGSSNLHPMYAFNRSGVCAFNSFIRYDAAHGRNVFARREPFNAGSTFETYEQAQKRTLKTTLVTPAQNSPPILKL